MNIFLLIMTLSVAVLGALMPTAIATPYNLCTPENLVCIVQSDSPYAAHDCDAQPSNYGPNQDANTVVVNAGVAGASAGGEAECANYHYRDIDYAGITATARVGDATARAHWRAYDIDYHWPGAPEDKHGEYVIVEANDGTSTTGVRWMHTVTPTEGTDTCDTTVTVQGSASSHGCPLGPPPMRPEAPWGQLLP